MAQPIPFKEMNCTAEAPPSAEGISSMPGHRYPGVFITKWRLSVKEIEQVSKHGHLWICLCTNENKLPALQVVTETPFAPNEEPPNG